MKYDKEHIDIIISQINEGYGRVRACKAANITHETFMNWMNQYSEFSDLVKKAELVGDNRVEDICKQKIIGDKSWQSAAWWLERNYPDRYRYRIENEVNVKEHREILKRMFDDTAEPEP